MTIQLEQKDLINTQQMEVAVHGPDGATHLILCTGIVELGATNHATYAFLVGPKIFRRQFVGAIASGAISTIQAHNRNSSSEVHSLDLEANIILMTARFDDSSSQVEVITEVSSSKPIAKLCISYSVNILAELSRY